MGDETPLVRVLLVEDDVERVSRFREWFAHPHIRFLHVTNGDTALHCVRTDRFNLILLDHDLVAGHPMGAEGKVNGRAVAQAIVEAPQHRRTPVIIHSMNPAGRNQMYQILAGNKHDVTIKPFGDWTAYYANDWLQDLLADEG